jgi:hypothetical protein
VRWSLILCFCVRFRTYKNTDLTVSEVGFGLWTISTGWWGNFTEGEAIALMHKAFDLGVTLTDPDGDSYRDIYTYADPDCHGYGYSDTYRYTYSYGYRPGDCADKSRRSCVHG